LIIKLYLKISSQENSEKKRRNGDWPYIKARYKTVIVKVGWHWHMNGNIHPEYSPEIDPNMCRKLVHSKMAIFFISSEHEIHKNTCVI
jgi:hypothetical protein